MRGAATHASARPRLFTPGKPLPLLLCLSLPALAAPWETLAPVLHACSPYRTHDFVQVIQRLPLGLKRMMYLEGGPEASLHVATPGRKLRRVGSYETGFNENDDNTHYWALPNVLGVVAPEKKSPSP